MHFSAHVYSTLDSSLWSVRHQARFRASGKIWLTRFSATRFWGLEEVKRHHKAKHYIAFQVSSRPNSIIIKHVQITLQNLN